ncbi:MAG: hypothetical protein J7605_08145 [Variovorax sp.]|nr:hypothetical protein [Variovorax sp.]
MNNLNPQILWLAVLFLVSLFAGVGYVTVGLRARDCLNADATDSHRSIGWLFWWSFETGRYNDEGKKLCRRAQALAIFIIGLYAAWYWLLMIRR